MKKGSRKNRVVAVLITALLLAFSGYCWQLLSQQQQVKELNSTAEVVLNRINADTVYLLGREQPTTVISSSASASYPSSLTALFATSAAILPLSKTLCRKRCWRIWMFI